MSIDRILGFFPRCFTFCGLKKKLCVPLSGDFGSKNLISSVGWHNTSDRRQLCPESLVKKAVMPKACGSKKKIAAKNHEARNWGDSPFPRIDVWPIETFLDLTYVDASRSEHDDITLVNEKTSRKSDLVNTTHFYSIRVKLILNRQMNANSIMKMQT